MKPLAEQCNEHQKKSGENNPGEMMASGAGAAGNTGEVRATGEMTNIWVNTTSLKKKNLVLISNRI